MSFFFQKKYVIFLFFVIETKKNISLQPQKLIMTEKHNISDVVAANWRVWSYYFYYCLKIVRDW